MASWAVPCTDKFPNSRTWACPAARGPSSHPGSSQFSNSSSRAVATTSSGAGPGNAMRMDSQDIVALSHHCRSSMVSRRGRSTARNARARPSKNRDRCQASTFARTPVPGSATLAPSGTSRSTSARQTGSRRLVAILKWGLRNQSATGASGTAPVAAKHRVAATTASCLRTAAARSATSLVLPTPAPPLTIRNLQPYCDRPHAASKLSRSTSRPTSAEDRDHSGEPADPASTRPRALPSPASTPSSSVRVSGEGATPSSRSSMEAQW